MAVLQQLIAAGADVNAVDEVNWTALQYAVNEYYGLSRRGRLGQAKAYCRTVELLLAAGTDANAADCRGDTPLLEAVRDSAVCVIQKLQTAAQCYSSC